MKKCIALKDFISPVYGNVDEGRVLYLEDNTATRWEEGGLVRIADTQEVTTELDTGKAEAVASLSASQAAPVSPKRTVSSSAVGVKKISRMKSGA